MVYLVVIFTNLNQFGFYCIAITAYSIIERPLWVVQRFLKNRFDFSSHKNLGMSG